MLGIDPGSRITGYGVIETDGRHSRHLASGCIQTAETQFADRLGQIFHALAQIVADMRPDEVAVEQVFMAKNAASALKLGQARGAAIAAVVRDGLPLYEYTPRAVKQAIVGTGAADKIQVAHMVKVLLNLRDRPAADQADALAVALCHVHASAAQARLGGVTGR